MELAEIILAVFVVGVLMLLFRKTKVTKRHLSTTEWKKIIDEIAETPKGMRTRKMFEIASRGMAPLGTIKRKYYASIMKVEVA